MNFCSRFILISPSEIAKHGAGAVACGRGRRPLAKRRPLIARYAWPGAANPHDWVDDRISDGRYNETRSLS